LRRRRRQVDFLQNAVGNIKCQRHSKTITASAEANKPSTGPRPRGRGIWFSRRIATLNNDTLQRSLDSVRLLAGLIEEANVAGRNV
jgi:hypothetical protein